MVIRVNLPDGNAVNFPDGTDKAEIERAISEHLGTQGQKAPQEELMTTGERAGRAVRETIEDFGKSAITGLAELPLNVAALATDVAGATGGETEAPAADGGLNISGRISQGLGFLGNPIEFINNPELRKSLLETDSAQIGKSIKNSLREVDRIQEEAKARSPIAAPIGEVGGQLLQLSGIPAGAVLKGAKQATGAGILAGATLQGLETPRDPNLTSEQSLEKRAEQLVMGGAIGGALPVPLQKTMQQAPVLFKKVTDIAKQRNIAPKMPDFAIRDTLQKVKDSIPFVRRPYSQGSARDVAKTLDNQAFNEKALSTKILGNNPNVIIQKRLQDRDLPKLLEELQSSKDVTLADIAGDEVRALTRRVGKASGGARNLVHDVIEGRAKATSDRVVQAINKSVSNVDDYYQNLDDISKLRYELSRPLYKQAYSEAPIINNKELNKFLLDPRIERAQDYIRTELGLRVEAKPNSLEALDQVKRALYDMEKNKTSNALPEAARDLRNLRQDLVKILDSVSPTYKKARDTFGGFSQMYDAQELGLKYSKMNVQALKRQIQELSPSELDAYRVGVRLSLEDQVYRTANSANEALKIFGKEIQKKQLKLVLGKDYEEFKKKMIREINFNDTKNRILGNSRTDYNQIDDASFAQSVVNSVRGGAIQATRYIVDAVADSLVNKYTGINEKNAKEIAEILLDNKKGIQYIQKLIKQQKTPLQKSLTDDIVNDFKDTL